jgi:hypothetical protein
MWRAGKQGNGCVSLSPLAYVAAYDHHGDLSAATRALRAAQGPTDLTGMVAPASTPTGEQNAVTAPVETRASGVAKDGATFILDENAELEARWGKGSEVLWARGESLVLAAPPGVGKTTLAGQLVAGLIGIQLEVLGYPVQPAQRVLYLAMDRPSQIRRALRRRFGEQHRATLAERLVVRPGPMPADLGKRPEMLIELAALHDCDSIVIDSLKDAAVKLTDDETGGNVNRAIQHCNAAEIDVLILHHQRKGTNGEKPTRLEDVYGSTWITAGAGSVFLLWGEAGSELVELSHLKQPADPVGPFTIEHDHHAGTSTISRGFDALAFLRLAGSAGVTVSETAQAEHGGIVATSSAKWKKTERRLRALARDGYARSGGQAAPGHPVRYYATDGLSELVDNSQIQRGHARGHDPFIHRVDTNADTSWTNADTTEETPGQSVDTNADTPIAPQRGQTPGGLYPRGAVRAASSQPPERLPLL